MEMAREDEDSARRVYDAGRMQLEAAGIDAETAEADADAYIKSRIYIPLARMYDSALGADVKKKWTRGKRRLLAEDIEKMFPLVVERDEAGAVSGITGGALAQEAASETLNNRGVKGITYVGEVDGRAFVVFDDNDVNIVETYYQNGAKGGENLNRAMPEKVFSSFDRARAFLKEQSAKTKKQGIENEHGDATVSLGVNGIDKMLSVKATEKSLANGFTRRDHVTAAASVLKLYKNSELLFTHTDNKRRQGVSQIKRFGAPVVLPDSSNAAVAYITVRELYGKDNKLYSMELVSFELLEAEKMPPGNLGPSTLREWNEPPAGGASNVTDNADAVNSENVEVTVNPGGLERLREKVDRVNEELRQYYQEVHGERGSITFPQYNGAPVTIRLGRDADRSTFVHETAHLYFWHLRNLSTLDTVQNSAAWQGEAARWNSELITISRWWEENAEGLSLEI